VYQVKDHTERVKEEARGCAGSSAGTRQRKPEPTGMHSNL